VSTDSPDPGTIHIASGVGASTGKPFVHLSWGEQSGELSPDEARMHGLYVLQCAEAAEHDATVFAELTDGVLELAPELAARFVLALRERRARVRGE
jgi:hypothetical protein